MCRFYDLIYSRSYEIQKIKNNKLSTFAGQRVTIQETVVFLYTSTEQPESEIKKTVLFTVVSKRINNIDK